MSKDQDIPVEYKRHLLKMADGGTISLDWAQPLTKGEGGDVGQGKVCVVYPGLSGGAESGYVKSLVRTLQESGFEVVVLHNRGVSNTEFTSPMFTDLTSNEEYFAALRYVAAVSGKPMVGVGMSLGANMLMRTAADMPDFPMRAIVAINNPFDIWLSVNLMRGKIYEKHLTRKLKEQLVLRDPINENDAKNYNEAIQKFDINL